MKTELFAPVLAWLEAGAPHTPEGIGFNMGHFVEPDEGDFDLNTCGTACCIAGAVQQFNGLPLPDGEPWAQIKEIGGAIGMTEDQSLRLFFAADKLVSNEGLSWPAAGSLLPGKDDLSDITPQRAAKTLRHFMETGEVVWA